MHRWPSTVSGQRVKLEEPRPVVEDELLDGVRVTDRDLALQTPLHLPR